MTWWSPSKSLVNCGSGVSLGKQLGDNKNSQMMGVLCTVGVLVKVLTNVNRALLPDEFRARGVGKVLRHRDYPATPRPYFRLRNLVSHAVFVIVSARVQGQSLP